MNGFYIDPPLPGWQAGLHPSTPPKRGIIGIHFF